LIRASITFEGIFAKQMDCRVKPGNDGLSVDFAILAWWLVVRNGEFPSF
jgi:hypothetical protein